MAEVDVISPDGELGSIPEEQLADARSQGFRLPNEAPAAAPAPDAAPADAEVEVRAPDGSIGTVPASQLTDALDQGYEETRHDQYRTAGQKIATAAEGGLRGATMGISDLVQAGGAAIGTGIGNWLADKSFGETPGVEHPLYDTDAQQASYADIQGRREANKALSVGTEIAGAAVPALLTGGVGSAAAMARATPAGQLASLSTKMLGELTKREGIGAMGRIGALAGIGAGEALVDNATRQVMDSLASGDVELSAERMLDGAWEATKAAALGGLVGGGLGAVAEGVSAGVRGAQRVGEAVAERFGGLGEQAGQAAYKAAVGRTSIAAQRLAARVGGDAEIGQTLLRRGVVKTGDTVDAIAERLPAELDSAGQDLGALLDEVADASTSKATILKRIEDEVIGPLDKAGTRDVADAVRAKLNASGIIDELSPSQVMKRGPDGPVPVDRDGIGLRELHALRRRFDQRPDLKWGASGPGPVDITTDAMRDVRRTIEDAFEQASDAAAKAKGVTDYAARLKQAKREYSQLAVANQVSEQGAFARSANNRIGLNDALAGVAGAASLGPAGALAAVGSKLIRDRSESVIATTLYKLAQRGVARERSLQGAVDTTLRNLASPAAVAAVPAIGRIPPANDVAQVKNMVAQAQALQDPNSPESQQLSALTLQLASESPEFAEAMRAKVMKRADFLVQKLGPSIDPSDPLKAAPMPVDRVTKSRTERFLRAAADPAAALDRLANGQGSAEDLQTVRELTPSIHKAYVDRVMQQVMGKGIKASQSQRQRLFFALGAPVERSQTPGMVAFYQSLHAGKQPENPDAAQGAPKPPNNTQDFDIDATSKLARSDAMMTPGGME
jgi:hypothetical protein